MGKLLLPVEEIRRREHVDLVHSFLEDLAYEPDGIIVDCSEAVIVEKSRDKSFMYEWSRPGVRKASKTQRHQRWSDL